MPTPRIFINDVPVLANVPARWALRAGIEPVTEDFPIDPENVNRLAGGGPVVLTMEVGGTEMAFENLWVLGFPPADSPNTAMVRLADSRVWWKRNHVKRTFNRRRNVSHKRIASDVIPDELRPVNPDVWYARYSLEGGEVPGNPGRPWTPHAVVRQVIEDATGGNAPVLVDEEGIRRNIPVENLELDDPGHLAIARMLKYFPEADIAVDHRGRISVFSRGDGSEVFEYTQATPEIVDRGHAVFYDRRLERPGEVHVLFTPERELRLDFKEGFTFVDGDRVLQNVLPCPDFELTLTDGRVVSQGTWITIGEALAAWGQNPPPLLNRIDLQILRRASVPFLGLFQAFAFADNFDDQSVWTPRIQALLEHYRTTFRVKRDLMDRLESIRAIRVATIDPENGTRAPAGAFCDYAVIPTSKYYAGVRPDQRQYAINMTAYPQGDTINANTKQAPALVSIVDGDQGVFKLDFRGHPLNHWNQVLPSKVDNIPQAQMARVGGVGFIPGVPVGWDIISDRGAIPELSDEHRCSVILTVVPGAPNSTAQLHRVIVRPGDVAGIVPPNVQRTIRNAAGPPIEIRVQPGVETARFAWTDANALLTEAALGLRPGSGDGLNPINAGLDSGEVGASLTQIARSAAAEIYTKFADRMLGQMSGQWTDLIQVGGRLREVAFSIDTDGTPTVDLNFPDEDPELPMYSFLDLGTRRIIYRLAQK